MHSRGRIVPSITVQDTVKLVLRHLHLISGSAGPAPPAQAAKYEAPSITAASGSLHSGFANFPAANGIRDTSMPVQTDFKGSFDSEPATNGSLI